MILDVTEWQFWYGRWVFDHFPSWLYCDYFLTMSVSVLFSDPLMEPVTGDYGDLLSCNAFNVPNCGQCHSNLHFDNLWLFEVLYALKFMHCCFTEGGFCQLVSMLCAARSLLNLVAHCQKLQTTVTDRITKTQWLGCLVDFYGLNWFHLNAIFLVHENISERFF